MSKGYLLITNNIAASHEDEFNAWYQAEHLDERLGVAGFLTARRYVAVEAPQRYAALYETESPELLRSPEYAALLKAPSPRTRAIMPHFQDVTRIIGRVAEEAARGAGGALAMVFVELSSPGQTDAQRLGALARALTEPGGAPEAVRVVIVEPDNVGLDTPESRLRGTPDRRADMVLLVEWARETTGVLRALHGALHAGGWKVDGSRGGLYRLLCARQPAGKGEAQG